MEKSLRKEKQHTYQEGKSAKSALAEVVTEIEKGIKSFALTSLLEIDGAMSRASASMLGSMGFRNSVRKDEASARQQECGGKMKARHSSLVSSMQNFEEKKNCPMPNMSRIRVSSNNTGLFWPNL